MSAIACPHCGAVIDHGRSGPDHRRLFAMIKAAYLNWPEGHEHQPSNEETLRAYLLVKAGHTNVATVEIPAGYAASETERAIFRNAVEGACRVFGGPGGYHELRVGDSALEVVTAKSINFATVGRREFNRIRESVEFVIEGALGVPADQLLKEKAA